MPLAIDINGNMTLPRGDTGAVTFCAKRSDSAAFGSNDRALFTIKNSTGAIVMQRKYSIDSDGNFTVEFHNADTDSLALGSYNYDTRYILNPSYDTAGNIIDGDQVITPYKPRTFTLIATVGEV